MRRLAIIFVVSLAAVAVDGDSISALVRTSGISSAASERPAGEAESALIAGAPRIAEALAAADEAPLAPSEPNEPSAQAPDDAEAWAEIDEDEPPDGPSDDDLSREPLGDERAEPAGEGAPVLVSVARETWVYAEPNWNARRLGYLRAGAVVGREAKPAGYRSCRRGWYRIEPRGFVCHNRAASLDPAHPVAQLSARRPFMGGLPYLYGMSRYPTPPLYARLPSAAAQREIESDLAGHLAKIARLATGAEFTLPPEPDPLPPALADGALLPALAGEPRGEATVSLGRARVRSGFGMIGSYEHEGRRFGLTTEMALIPLDRLRVVPPSTLRGVALSDEFTLPIAIVTSKRAQQFREHPESGALAIEGPLAHRAVVSLSGETRRRGGQLVHELTGGGYVRADQVVRIDRFNQAPKWARAGKKWIDVSILRQSLVAYEGTRPVYATLVSTGADGIADPKESHATVQGAFLIHTKHVSVTMDGDDAGDEFDLRDVPFVQYFNEGYALHAAYWHDDFGRPRSHGCVNLAPVDAAWLFRWTDPVLPEGWHAALSLTQGTVIYIHP